MIFIIKSWWKTSFDDDFHHHLVVRPAGRAGWLMMKIIINHHHLVVRPAGRAGWWSTFSGPTCRSGWMMSDVGGRRANSRGRRANSRGRRANSRGRRANSSDKYGAARCARDKYAAVNTLQVCLQYISCVCHTLIVCKTHFKCVVSHTLCV